MRHPLNTGLPAAHVAGSQGKGDATRIRDWEKYRKEVSRIFKKKGKR